MNAWSTATPTKSGVYIGYNGTPLVCVRLLGLDGQFIDNYLMQTGWGDWGAIENIAPKLWLRIDVERPTWIDEANANLANVDLNKRR